MELSHAPIASAKFSPDLRRASPTRVLSTSLSQKIGVVLGLLVSSYAFFSFLVFPIGNLSIWLGLRVMGTFICAGAVTVFCWPAFFSYFIRKFNLSPTWCRWAGAPFLLLGALSATADLLGIARHSNIAPPLILAGILISDTCRRLAYPAISSKQMNNREERPPGIF
jgi:hypothetical protein